MDEPTSSLDLYHQYEELAKKENKEVEEEEGEED